VIQINAILPPQRTKRGTMKWSVTAMEPDKKAYTAKFETCGLAVEYGRLLAEVERWHGLSGEILVGDDYGLEGCEPALRALRRRGVEPVINACNSLYVFKEQ
jgi:hypothetical protein